MRDLMVLQGKDLKSYLDGLTAEEDATKEISGKIIELANERGISPPQSALTAFSKAEARLKALNEGFLPIEGISFVVLPFKLPKKKKQYDWAYNHAKRLFKMAQNLPEQVKEAIEEAKSLGIFEKIMITRPGGDPIIVGLAGGYKFFIASWVQLREGFGMGFRVRYSNRVSGTAVNCEKDGHCWHGGTAVGSLYCCRCGKYLYPSIANLDTRITPIPSLTISKPAGILDIRRIRIFKYDDNGNFIKEIL